MSGFNAVVVDSLKALDPNGRLEKRSFRVGKTDIGSPTTGMRTIPAVPDDHQMSLFIANK